MYDVQYNHINEISMHHHASGKNNKSKMSQTRSGLNDLNHHCIIIIVDCARGSTSGYKVNKYWCVALVVAARLGIFYKQRDFLLVQGVQFFHSLILIIQCILHHCIQFMRILIRVFIMDASMTKVLYFMKLTCLTKQKQLFCT